MKSYCFFEMFRRTTNPLPSQDVDQNREGGFFGPLIRSTRGQHQSHRVLEGAEKCFNGPVRGHAQEQKTPTDDEGQHLDPIAPMAAATALEMGAGRSGFQSGGVHRGQSRFYRVRNNCAANGLAHGASDLQHSAAEAELLQSGVVGQSIGGAEVPAQFGADGRQQEEAVLGGLGQGSQNEAGHDLAPGEIMAGGVGPKVGRMPRTPGTGQSSHLFNRLDPLNSFTRSSLVVSSTQKLKKDLWRPKSFHFEPTLFQERQRAFDALEHAGFDWFVHFMGIDLIHDLVGLEVCSIKEKADAFAIQRLLCDLFPAWTYSRCFYKDWGREIGWKVEIHKYREKDESFLLVGE